MDRISGSALRITRMNALVSPSCNLQGQNPRDNPRAREARQERARPGANHPYTGRLSSLNMARRSSRPDLMNHSRRNLCPRWASVPDETPRGPVGAPS
jgi:hypothetical protein